MNEINPVGQPNASHIGRHNRLARPNPASPASSLRGHDRVELSRAAQLISRLNELPDIRHELVNRVRKEIANGSYETSEKIDLLMNNLAEDLF